MVIDLKDILFRYPARLLGTVLCLVALHSFLIGLALITQPVFLMKAAGFGPGGYHFFPAQGGVFHILMAVMYLTGAVDIKKYHYFIVFAIVVKAAATLFLMLYFFVVDYKWIILLSGISDFAMGLMIYMALRNYLNSNVI